MDDFEERPASKGRPGEAHEAKYSGYCIDCKKVIKPGEVVQQLMPSGELIHEWCP